MHNMLVCQVATFSPIFNSMSLKECTSIDKQLLISYQYRMNYMPTDAKHSIFYRIKKVALVFIVLLMNRWGLFLEILSIHLKVV
jgi:hypothetical protein